MMTSEQLKEHYARKLATYEKRYIDDMNERAKCWSEARQEVYGALVGIEKLQEDVYLGRGDPAEAQLKAMAMLARSLTIVFDEVSSPNWHVSEVAREHYNRLFEKYAP